MYVYEISGAPVSWKSHKGTGKRSYSPRIKEKEVAQWQLKMQHKQKPLITGAVRVDFFFEMPIPKSMSQKMRKRIASGEKIWCVTRPDATNLRKFFEDCLVGTVLYDDNIVVSGETKKYYAKESPRTVVYVVEF